MIFYDAKSSAYSIGSAAMSVEHTKVTVGVCGGMRRISRSNWCVYCKMPDTIPTS